MKIKKKIYSSFYQFSDSETHGIYTKLLYRHLIGDIENESTSSKVNFSNFFI